MPSDPPLWRSRVTGRQPFPGRRAPSLRRRLNLLNLSTPAGLLLARLTGCRLTPGPHGVLLAAGYSLSLPRAAAFTVGNVILYRGSAAGRITARNSPLLRHEMRHCTQYAVLGPLFLPLYAAASVISRLAAGNPATANPFERLAGLHDGGYPAAGIRHRKG